MYQMSILYNSHMSAVARLKNTSVPKEGHTINPAFHVYGEGSANTDQSDDHSLQPQTTIDLIQDTSKASISPWNIQNSRHQGKHTSANSKSKTNTALNKKELEISPANDDNIDDDMPPGLNLSGSSKV